MKPHFAVIFTTERKTVPAGTRTADLSLAALHKPSALPTYKLYAVWNKQTFIGVCTKNTHPLKAIVNNISLLLCFILFHIS